MRYFFSGACRAIAPQLAAGRTLCAFDFDGTLSPIVDRPDQAHIRPSTRRLLACLVHLYPCTVISGRARPDLLNKLRGIRIHRVIGNHGAETAAVAPTDSPLVGQWKSRLEPVVATLPGAWIETKGFSLAVHYRQSPNKAAARHHILDAAQHLNHAHIFGGKHVINLAPQGAPNKGIALAAERDRLKCRSVLYVGDDDNDEDAFAIGGHMVSVRIGRKRNSHACYYLRRQCEIDRLLTLLIHLRS